MDTEKNNFIWLDESFAKGVVGELEASCCLAACSQENVRIDDILALRVLSKFTNQRQLIY